MQFKNLKLVDYVVYGRGAFNQLDEIIAPRRKSYFDSLYHSIAAEAKTCAVKFENWKGSGVKKERLGTEGMVSAVVGSTSSCSI